MFDDISIIVGRIHNEGDTKTQYPTPPYTDP